MSPIPPIVHLLALVVGVIAAIALVNAVAPEIEPAPKAAYIQHIEHIAPPRAQKTVWTIQTDSPSFPKPGVRRADLAGVGLEAGSTTGG